MNQIKYKHYRYMRYVATDFCTRIPYYAISNLGGYTMAYQQLDNGDFVVGVSKCSANDNFEKAQGRRKAFDRMSTDRLVVPKEDFLSHMKLVRDAYSMSESVIARKSIYGK